jgi:hypothetical protein
VLENLVYAYSVRGGNAVCAEDLDDWIRCVRELRDAFPEDEGLRRHYAGQLSAGLAMPATNGDDPCASRDEAIVLLEEIVQDPALAEPARASYRQMLGQLLLLRVLPPGLSWRSDTREIMRALASAPLLTSEGARRDVDSAIDQLSRVSEEPALDAASRGVALALLGQAVLLRGSAQLAGPDQDRVIGCLERARRELPAWTPGRGELVFQLGQLRSERAVRRGVQLADVDAAIEELTEAERLIRPGHPVRPMLLRELGMCRMRRLVATGDHDDQAGAIDAFDEAIQLMEPSDPMRADTLGMLGPLLLGPTASRTPTGSPDRIIAVMREALSAPLIPRREAEFRVHLGNALCVRFSQTKQDSDSTEAIRQFRQAADLVPDPADDIHLLALTASGSALADRYDARQDVQDIDAAIDHLATVDAALAERPAGPASPFGFNPPYVRSLLASARLQKAHRNEQAGRPQDDLAAAIDGLEAALAALPPNDPMAPRMRNELAVARVLLANRTQDTEGWRRGVSEIVALALAVPPDHPDRATLLGRAGYAQVSAAEVANDAVMLDRGISMLDEALMTAKVGDTARIRHLIPLGDALFARYRLRGQPQDLDRAVSRMEEAWTAVEARPGHPLAPLTARTLALAYRTRADAARQDLLKAHATARDGLRAHARNVLLQTGAERGLTLARAAAEDVLLATMRCLADGYVEDAVAALETGRGLVLHATTTASDLPGLLSAAGHPELATEWAQASPGQGRNETTEYPSPESLDLRHRTLAALSGDIAHDRLLSPPTITDIARALRIVGRDALVYLVPEVVVSPAADGVSGIERYGGRAIVVWFDGSIVQLDLPDLRTDGGPTADYAAAQSAALNALRQTPAANEAAFAHAHMNETLTALCDWAWDSTMGRLLAKLSERMDGREPAIVLVPVGMLGIVPWHAARQLAEAASRPRLPVDSGVVLVANPDGTLPWAGLGAQAIRGSFYPTAEYLGLPSSAATGTGTAQEVLSRLPGPSAPGVAVLEFDCHAENGDSPARARLHLADGDLKVDRILRHTAGRPTAGSGGLVLLSACVSDLVDQDFDEALTLATSFLAAGAVSVIGSRWAIDDAGTAVFMYMFHHYFHRGATSPGAALRATQLWMLDPRRAMPPGAPAHLAALASKSELARIESWGAFSHHGR